MLLFKICHSFLASPLLPLRPTAFLSRELSKLPTSPRGVGAHPLATGHPTVQQSPKTTGLFITFAHLSLGFATLTPTTNHFQRSPGRGAFSPAPRCRNPCTFIRFLSVLLQASSLRYTSRNLASFPREPFTSCTSVNPHVSPLVLRDFQGFEKLLPCCHFRTFNLSLSVRIARKR